MGRSGLIFNFAIVLLLCVLTEILGQRQLDGCYNCGCYPNCGGDTLCPGLYEPVNGYTEGQCNPGIVGQTCLYRCNGGYALEGQSRITCLNSGQWSSSPPYCQRTSGAMCESLVVRNGYAACNQEGGLTICRVTCDSGYMLVGSSIITCYSSGSWSDQIPSCRRTGTEVLSICPTLNAPDGGRVVGSCTSANTGDTCQLVCLSGYRPSDTRVLVCQSNGVWSSSLPRCIGGSSSQCPSIYVNSGSTSGSCTSATSGQTCTITCNSGYTLTGGNPTLVCGSNGQWSSAIPTCSERDRSCPTLTSPSSGGTSGTCSPGSAGQTCTFFCNYGYRLVGQATLVCGSDGRWSGNPPYCTGSGSSSCPNLVTPANGYMGGTCTPGRVGESCVFACDNNYVLRGQRTLTCQSNGQWSSNQPYCERGGGGGDGGSCPVLTPPPNGEFVECDNRPGGRCVVVCERGYLRSGSRTRTCLSQGTWSGFAPTCTRTVGYTTYTYRVVPLWSLMFG